jgi:hypothetical protein
MVYMDSLDTVPKQAKNGLEKIIRTLDPDDSNVFALTEAYAQFWLMDLEDTGREDTGLEDTGRKEADTRISRDASSRDAIQPIFEALADDHASLDPGWRIAV